jgi:hypothetical protein
MLHTNRQQQVLMAQEQYGERCLPQAHPLHTWAFSTLLLPAWHHEPMLLLAGPALLQQRLQLPLVVAVPVALTTAAAAWQPMPTCQQQLQQQRNSLQCYPRRAACALPAG